MNSLDKVNLRPSPKLHLHTLDLYVLDHVVPEVVQS